MRTSDTVYFVVKGAEEYDELTGNYEESKPDKTAVPALVTDTGTERMNLLYGGIKQHAKTVRLNAKYTEPFDHVEIGGKDFQVDMIREYRHKMTVEVSGL